jgi:hypothetical protein
MQGLANDVIKSWLKVFVIVIIVAVAAGIGLGWLFFG